jgi:hypothetical protein
MGGQLTVLLEDGTLGDANWRDDPLGSYWTVSDIRVMSGTAGMRMLDYADRGRWRKVRPLQGEQYREEFDRQYVLTAHAAGVGLSLSLKRLLDGDGLRLNSHATGMQHKLLGP